MTPEEFENKLWVALLEAGQDCLNDMRADHKSTPEHLKVLERAVKTIGASRKLGDILLRAYQNVSHGGPTRVEVEAVLKEAGLL